MSTSFSLNHFIVPLISGRIWSRMTNIAIFSFLVNNAGSSSESSFKCPLFILTNKMTRIPFLVKSELCSNTRGSFVRYSGAPNANKPLSSNSTAEYFLSLENSNFLMILKYSFFPYFSIMADEV